MLRMIGKQASGRAGRREEELPVPPPHACPPEGGGLKPSEAEVAVMRSEGLRFLGAMLHGMGLWAMRPSRGAAVLLFRRSTQCVLRISCLLVFSACTALVHTCESFIVATKSRSFSSFFTSVFSSYEKERFFSF